MAYVSVNDDHHTNIDFSIIVSLFLRKASVFLKTFFVRIAAVVTGAKLFHLGDTIESGLVSTTG